MDASVTARLTRLVAALGMSEMSSLSITRRHPKTGRTETPLLEHGWYVLGDPAHGKQKHHKRFAVRVRTLEEVLDHLRRGFSVRMTDGSTPWPSLISPKSLEIRIGGVSV